MLKRTLFLTLILTASASFASDPKRLSVLLGHPTTLSLPDEVSSVTLSNPSKLEVKKSGRKVTLLGVEKGTTEVAINVVTRWRPPGRGVGAALSQK